MVDDFLKNSGYTIKAFDNNKNLSDIIMIEETQRRESDEDGDYGIYDLEQEELINLDDFISDDDDDYSEDESDVMNDAILLDEI